MYKTPVYLDDEWNARIKEDGSVHGVEEYFSSLLHRIERRYFVDKFGKLPEVHTVTYPRAFGAVVNRGLEVFIPKHGLKPVSLYDVPFKEDGEFYIRGQWWSTSEQFFLEISNESDTLEYTLTTKDLETCEHLSEDLRKLVGKQFFKKILRVHTAIPEVVTKKIVAESASWAELKSTLDPHIAIRMETVVLPFFGRVERFRKAGVDPKLGILMHGLPGTGKTYLVKTLIRELRGQATIVHLASDQLVAVSPTYLRRLFTFLRQFSPLVLILEDIEALMRSRENLSDSPHVQSLLDIMDGAVDPLDRVMFIATTNVADQIDPAFKRPGRFDEIWRMDPPSAEQVLPALKSYFEKAQLAIPKMCAERIAGAELTYAQVRFVATELIRQAIVADKDRVEVTKEELDDICALASTGVVRERALGFRSKWVSEEGDVPAIGGEDL